MAQLDGLAEFLAVAETRGFSSAARQLGVSTSHVSRRVKALETRLGVSLVARSTRIVRLTEAGQQYYNECRDLMNGLEAVEEQIGRERGALEGRLRVSAAGEFAERYVAPALMRFSLAHPALQIEIDFNSRLVNFVEEGFDLAVRYGDMQDSQLIARPLVARALVCMASPEYLAAHGTPQRPQDLTYHHCIIANSDRWRFREGAEDTEVRVSGRWRSNSGRSVVVACQAGLGIAYLPGSSFGDAAHDGTLKPVLEGYWAQGPNTWLVYRDHRHLSVRVRAAIDFLLETFADWREEESAKSADQSRK
ncbi:LysR family transcriptional regulator [Microbulbifer agarilyticus]|uniref:LysR family transcriptional regulator n=1 Tax=Microbulbifer agarilyticus TaxID=260552 RepID=UPI001C976B75|nr:LysR family transcriptional regulator [Microbulbifer agarilyticus]MBY6210181.1 LysR family transcriptional regulator [Microbulbifer agarilyticus]